MGGSGFAATADAEAGAIAWEPAGAAELVVGAGASGQPARATVAAVRTANSKGFWVIERYLS
jgi:hypothetical protein